MRKHKKLIIILSVVAVCILIAAISISIALYLNYDDGEEVVIADTLPDGEGKRATVIILGGQSNASGASLDEYLKKTASPEKYAEYERGYDNVFINYISGLKKSGEFVKCSVRQGELEDGFGPELGIADKLNELYPDETFFIIKCAFGGSNLYRQWLSPTSFGKTGELYHTFSRFVKANLEYLKSKNYDISIEAMCWMQGESDSFSIDTAEDYEKNLKNLIKDIRKDFKAFASDDGIAFVDAYIAENPTYWVHYEVVNAAKRSVSASSELNALVDTVLHGLTCEGEPLGSPDLAHYDSESQIKLGHLFAEESAKFFDLRPH